MTCTILPFSEFKHSSPLDRIYLPILTCKVAAGFPSPADDHLDNSLNLNDLLIKHPSSTFLVRASGTSMQGTGILNNDILIVDRSQTPSNGCIVIASINGECLVKFFKVEIGKVWLKSANPDFPDVLLQEDMEVEIWGVVTGVVRPLKG